MAIKSCCATRLLLKDSTSGFMFTPCPRGERVYARHVRARPCAVRGGVDEETERFCLCGGKKNKNTKRFEIAPCTRGVVWCGMLSFCDKSQISPKADTDSSCLFVCIIVQLHVYKQNRSSKK